MTSRPCLPKNGYFSHFGQDEIHSETTAGSRSVDPFYTSVTRRPMLWSPERNR